MTKPPTIRRKLMLEQRAVDLLFTLALFCVFAASSLMVVLIGAQVYQTSAAAMQQNFSHRTSVSYVAAKIRQNDSRGAIRVAPLGEGTALVLQQSYGSTVYENWIYQWDGKLREVLVAQGLPFDPATGQAIMDLQAFSAKQTAPKLLTLRFVNAEGQLSELMISPRCTYP